MNNNKADNILASFFKAMAEIIISGQIPVGKYYETTAVDSLTVTMPGTHHKCISFAPKRRILFIRLMPIFGLLRKRGYFQDFTLKELEQTICSNPSFLGHISSHRFKYSEYDIPLIEKTFCASCIALDYDIYRGRLTNKIHLHPTQAWEDARPGHIIYDHFFYKEQTHEVRKVTGRIKIVKRIPINGRLVKKDCYRQARWDGFGHCYLGTHNIRSRQSDIVFPSFEDLKGISYGK